MIDILQVRVEGMRRWSGGVLVCISVALIAHTPAHKAHEDTGNTNCT
jgi:hypothetical protein